MKALPVLIKKELIQFRRNSFLPKLVMTFPLMVMLVMPWVTQLDIKNIRIAVIDDDRSSLSRRTISHITASDYFIYTDQYPDYHNAINAMDMNQIDVLVCIPSGFESGILSGVPKQILIEANGVNAIKGQQGIQYVVQSLAKTLKEKQYEAGMPFSDDVIVVQNRYNETQNAQFYMIPALMIILILLLCGFLPALNIVSEKENGTIEQINVTPVGRFEFILAKLIPFWVMGLLVFSVAILLAHWVYGLYPVGSFATIYAGAILFTVIMSATGVTIANVADNMQQSVFLVFFFMLIFMLMSGLLTPVSSMPDSVRWISYLCPPRYFINIMRSVYLKGTTFTELWADFTALTLIASLFTAVAILTYKKQN